MSNNCLITYVGGKHYTSNIIINILDYSKTTYIELFGGSGKILLGKHKHSRNIYNDINYGLYSLFYTVKNYPEEFLDRLRYMVPSEKLFYDYRDLNTTDIIDNAVKTFVVYNLSFAGMGNRFGLAYKKVKASRLTNKIKNIRAFSEKLKDVEVWNKDFREVLELIKDEEDIMLYADPPYYGVEHYYDTGFGLEEHKILAEYLNKARYSVMISYYYFDMIEELYPRNRWAYLVLSTNRCIPKIETRGKVQELLLSNYRTNLVY